MKESDIQKQIIDYMESSKYLVERMPLGGILMHCGKSKFMRKNQLKGFPDIFFVFKDGSGKMGTIEVKTERSKLTNEQKKWRDKLKEFGVFHLVARCLQDVKDVL